MRPVCAEPAGAGPAGGRGSRLLVVEHQDTCSADRLGGWLEEAGVVLDVLRPYRGDALPDEVGADGLLVLGGAMGAYDDSAAPWLPATRRLLAAAVGDGTPTLGVCLGAQLLAVACGGRVEVGDGGIEAGVVDVRWREEAAGDPLVGGLAGTSSAGPSMHLDAVVELPPGAVWLAQTSAYPHQAFRLGDRAWGVQFHPEVSLPTFRTWSAHHADDWARWGLAGDDVVGQLVRRDDEVQDVGRQLAGRFARLLAAGRPGGRAAGPAGRHAAEAGVRVAS